MSAADLFGFVAPAPEFVDIRNQRESVAEEKARLCLELNGLCKTPPPCAGCGVDQRCAGLASRTEERTEGAGGNGLQSPATRRGDQQHAGLPVTAPALTDDMVAAMDEVAEFVHTKPAFTFAPSGIKHERAPKIIRIKGLVAVNRHGIPITGRVQGEADMHRRDSIKRGGI